MTTFDWGLLLPVLAPVLGAVVVLVVDIAVPRVVLGHYVVAGISLVIGAAGTMLTLRPPVGDTRATLCLPGAGDRASSCFYAVTGVGAGLQLAALLA
ncbi:MAG: hypothetical protein M3Y71_17620, partial [Actinomycetota bacterium]|nr:hypothetical protein [Actinomycetota bacterium]